MPDPQTPTPKPVPDADALLARLAGIVSELKIPSLDELGSVDLRRRSNNQPRSLRAGVHLVKPGAAPTFAPLSAPAGWTAAATDDPRVVRYQSSQLVDTAVILADEVVLDGDVIVLSDNVTQFVIAARTIKGVNGAAITWVGAGTAADPLPAPAQAALGTPTYLPDDSTGGTFRRRNGGDGADGEPGRIGNPGTAAPDMLVYVKKFTRDPNSTSSGHTYQASLPNVDFRGQGGGEGQKGQRGGNGGSGAKGRKAINGNFGDCKSGPGYGGHGGEGGKGGDAGRGGPGGNGGHIVIQYVKHPADTNLHAAEFLYAGGTAGAGGAAGLGGRGGEGGEAGNRSGNCSPRPERRGDDGEDGVAGHPGAAGFAGASGSAAFQQIPLAKWEAAFTKPYIVRAPDARVGDTVVFETLNVSGAASLRAVDDLAGTTYNFTIQEIEEDKYRWAVPDALTASAYTVTIHRSHDGKESNSYRIELRPRIDGVQFDDAYDARPGGTAYISGAGFRDDVEVIYDGTRIAPGHVTAHRIEFAIPVLATDGMYFSRVAADTVHTVYLDQPFPLSDSDSTTLALKRTDGLTFVPSVNGFEFKNGDMFDAARNYVTEENYTASGILHAFYGSNGFGGRAYELFRETYGSGEVEGLGGVVSPLVWANFGLWYNYWSSPEQGGTGTCFGLSTLSLHDFFEGIPTEKGKTIGHLVRGISILHERQVSDEILRLQIAETMLDAVGVSSGGLTMTELAVRYIAGFFQRAEDGEGLRYAPIMLFLPSFSAYGDVLVQAANLIGETVNLWDGISPQAAWNDLDAAYHTMTKAFKRGHAVTPYRVVYKAPSDTLPSRIYFYDNNKPGNDDVYLDVYREGGRVKFKYDEKYATDGTFASGTPGGFMIGVVPVGLPLGNVDLLFDEDLLGPNLGLAAAEGIYTTVATMLDASKFLGTIPA